MPIIADEVVDPAFGTGAVKITPAHDHDDYADRASGTACAMPTILDDAAAIAGTGTAYDGLDRYAARDARSSPTSRRAATSPASAPTRWSSARCERSDDVVEPRLKTQWFIRTGPLAAAGPRGDPERAGPGSSPTGSRRPGSTG